MGHLRALGLADLRVTPDPVRVASEAALWGAIEAEGLLGGAVVVSDDAGQFRVGDHALCWVHAERLIHKLLPAKTAQRRRGRQADGLVVLPPAQRLQARAEPQAGAQPERPHSTASSSAGPATPPSTV